MKINKHIKELEYPEYATSSHKPSRINLAQQKGRDDTYGYALAQDRGLLRKIVKLESVLKENILITAGADGALHHVAETFLDMGKTSVIPLPTFGRFEFHTKVVGAKVVFVKHTNFPYSFDLKKITKVAKENEADIIFIANPNNPTGELIDKKLFERFIKENKCLVVVDEVLLEQIENSVAPLVNQCKNLVVIKSFSKLFALPGLRIGYIIANKKLLNEIAKTVSPYEVSGLSLEAVKRMQVSRKYIKKMGNELQKARELLKKQLALSISNTDASVVLILGKNNVSFFDYLLKHDILTVEGKNFRGLEETNSVRIVITNRKEMEKLIDVVKRY